MIAVFIVVAAALVTAGRRCRGTPAERRLSWTLAVVFAVFLVSVEIYWLLPWQVTSKFALPLQLCDLAGIAAVWALCSYSSTAFALTYFWGLTLTSQAFISPELGGPDFPSLQFLSFFGLHSMVVWAA
ncbi:MAG: TIGR02206 family membrane protein, partial [Pseudonocardiaceae bacterium]